MLDVYTFEGTATVVRKGWEKRVPLHFKIYLHDNADKGLIQKGAAIIANEYTKATLAAQDRLLQSEDEDV